MMSFRGAQRRIRSWLVNCGFLAALGMTSIAGAQDPIRAGASVSKDTVTVGEAFEVRLRVRAPVGAEIRFPENPDTAGTVQARDPRTIVTTDSTQSLDQTAIYRMSAWDVGRQPIQLGEVVVLWSNASSAGERSVPVANLTVFVRTVLPADSTLRVPKPARPLWEIKPFPWWILAAILAAIAIGIAIWWWMRRRRRAAPVVIVDPYVRAQKEFTRLEAMGLVDAGERTRFVALAVEVLRDYLAARYSEAELSLTSRELVAALRRSPAIPNEQLSRVLHEADLAKFARWSLTEERARNLAREAKNIVEHEHRASQPAPEEPRAAA